MIRCNLAILLAERNLKITKLSNDTGISRTTLTSLSNNYSRGIQFDTINTLCNYLKISPEKLIDYVPVDIKINDVSLDDDILDVRLTITKNNRSFNCGLTGTCRTYFTNGKIVDFDIHIELWDEEIDSSIKEENLIITNAFNLLPVPFLEDIKDNIFDKILSNFDDENIDDPISFSFSYDNSLIADYSGLR